MDNSIDYQSGMLVAEIQNLKHEINYLRSDIKELKDHVDLLKQWKAQVVGISIGVSFLTSAILSGIAALAKWK